MSRRLLAVACAWTAACTTFEDPSVVVDLRVLAMEATPPDQVIDVDLTQPASAAMLFGQLQTTTVCALVADPELDRSLAWSMTACEFNRNETLNRCNPDRPQIAVASGVIADPDTTPFVSLCGEVLPSIELLTLLAGIVEDDPLHGLGGVDFAIVLRIGGDTDPQLSEFAFKTLRIAPRIPETRTANHNPVIEQFVVTHGEDVSEPLQLRPCAETGPTYVMDASQRLVLAPVAPDGARETYSVPTLDGSSQTFTETLTYQWISSAGGFSRATSGGPRDFSGNPAPLSSEFRPPPKDEIDGHVDVSLWIIQRDERLGVHWYQSCIRVNAEPADD